MTQNAITDLNYDEFQSLVDGFIDRSSQETGEMEASTFFELLFERLAERTTETIELEGEVVGGQLVFHLPTDLDSAVHVRDNQILLGNQRIVIKLKDDTVYPSAS